MIGLVTGAARGLGYELVQLGLGKGYEMIAACAHSMDENSRLTLLKEKYPDQLTIIQMDVTDENQVEEAAQLLGKSYGKVDFLINNAGVLFESKYDKKDAICDLDIKQLRKTIDVNTVGPAIVLKYFMPLLYQSEEACIIVITSEAGHLSPEGYQYLAYSVSKHGVNMYAQKIRNYLEEEKQDKKVRIYMVHPGRMQTDMGAENAQIPALEAAVGIFAIVDKKVNPQMSVPFINYKGEAMPY